MPCGDGTGPAWAQGAGVGCGRGFGGGRGFGYGRRMGFAAGSRVCQLPVEEQKKLLEQRKAEIEAQLKELEASKG